MEPNAVMRFLSSKPWRIERTIFDVKLNSQSAFEGTASFISTGAQWTYEEQGQLSSRGESYAASRRYIYEIQNSSLTVRFDDNRLFHSIDCNELPQTRFEHICGEDKYAGNIIIDSQTWKNNWRVLGPNKDLEILTSYI